RRHAGPQGDWWRKRRACLHVEGISLPQRRQRHGGEPHGGRARERGCPQHDARRHEAPVGPFGGGLSALLKLRRGRVVSVDDASERVIHLTVELGGELRRAIAYPGLTGGLTEGDEVIVNVEAVDIGLG